MNREPLSDTDYALLDRFFAGETSAAENEMVHALLAHWPEVAERVQVIVRGVRGLMPDAPEAGRSWEMVAGAGLAYQAGMREKSARSALRGIGVLGPQTLPRWASYVMAIAIVGALGLAVGWRGGAHQRVAQTPRAAWTYATTNGQRANITLLDGTTVALDVASQLDVPADFASGNHTVYLSGEALFTVSHHVGTPFTVVSGPTRTQVLGTSFLVRRYPGDTTTMVAVGAGRVAVGSAIVAAQRFIEVARTGMIHNGPAEMSDFSFAAGTLTVIDTPLPEAIAELDRWFDVDIRIGDPVLARQRIEGKFAAGSVADLTTLFEMVFDVRVVRTGRVLTLYPRH